MNRRDLEIMLIRKVWKDSEFRNLILLDPKGTVEKYLGCRLPDEVRIFVHEEDSNTIHFSIPLMPTDLEELSDDSLGRIWGGEHTWAQVLSGIAGGVALTMAANPW